jgi:hypothetical protein
MARSDLKDLTGKRFGLLTVVEIDKEKSRSQRIYWKCKCDCGSYVSVRTDRFKTQRSCGCIRADSLVLGQTFGRLTVIEPDFEKTKEKGFGIYFKCQCACGNMHSALLAHLRSGGVKSCGCYCSEKAKAQMTTHDKSNTRLFRIWSGMKSRCLNSNVKDYYRYGARGIQVCKEWECDFLEFYNWAINNGYSDKLSLDRKNNNEGYNPSNCKWSTILEQQNNTMVCISVVVNNKWYSSIREVSRKYNIPPTTVSKYLKRGNLEEYINKRINKEKEPK